MVLLLLKEQMIISVTKTLTALVRSILVKFAQKIAMKLVVFYPLFLGEIWPEISPKIGCFFLKFVFENPAKLSLFRNLSEALIICERAPVLNNSSSKPPTNI